MATIYIDGNEHELPKMTLALEEAFDRAADKFRPKRERARDAFKLLKDCVGIDAVAERCGGKTIETVDVVEMWGMFAEVRDAYFADMESAEIERVAAQFDSIAPLLDKMAKVAPLARQGFSNVR